MLKGNKTPKHETVVRVPVILLSPGHSFTIEALHPSMLKPPLWQVEKSSYSMESPFNAGNKHCHISLAAGVYRMQNASKVD